MLQPQSPANIVRKCGRTKLSLYSISRASAEYASSVVDFLVFPFHLKSEVLLDVRFEELSASLTQKEVVLCGVCV